MAFWVKKYKDFETSKVKLLYKTAKFNFSATLIKTKNGRNGINHLKCWTSILGCFVPDISQENDCQKKIEFWVINIPLAVGGQSL